MGRSLCFFVSDLHGYPDRYAKLFRRIRGDAPTAVFLGGDLLPTNPLEGDFLDEVLAAGLGRLRAEDPGRYPRVFLILGNDDPRSEEPRVLAHAGTGLWEYLHARRSTLGDFAVYGYSFVPPTPFSLKDWERYDVSRHTDPGSVSPEDGERSVPIPPSETKWSTMARDLDGLVGDDDLSRAILLLHAPPYGGSLDRAALDGRQIDHAPLDVHVGSIAIRRLIERRQPLLSLHGHVHESARLTGEWRERIGRTWCLSAAHDGVELALVRFDPEVPSEAWRELL